MRLDLRDVRLAARVLAIQRAAYTVEAEIVGYDAIPPLHETLADLQARTDLLLLGASVNRTLAGVLGYERTGDAVDIDRLAVDPPFFRRGVARRLLREATVRERDADRWTVSTGFGNGPAVAFYEAAGFVVVGDSEPFPGVRTVQLERRQP